MPICVGGFGRLETLIAVDINYMHSPAAEVYPVHRDSFVASLADTERSRSTGWGGLHKKISGMLRILSAAVIETQ